MDTPSEKEIARAAPLAEGSGLFERSDASSLGLTPDLPGKKSSCTSIFPFMKARQIQSLGITSTRKDLYLELSAGATPPTKCNKLPDGFRAQMVHQCSIIPLSWVGVKFKPVFFRFSLELLRSCSRRS